MGLRTVQIDIAEQFEEGVICHIADGAAVAGVDVEGLPETANDVFDDIGGVVGSVGFEEVADGGGAADVVVHLTPHGIVAGIALVGLPDRERRDGSGENTVPLIEAQVFFGVGDAGRDGAEDIVELPGDGIVVQCFGALVAAQVFCRGDAAEGLGDPWAEIAVPFACVGDNAGAEGVADFDVGHVQRITAARRQRKGLPRSRNIMYLLGYRIQPFINKVGEALDLRGVAGDCYAIVGGRIDVIDNPSVGAKPLDIA